MRQSLTLILLYCTVLPLTLVYIALKILPPVLWLVFYPGYIANRGHHIRKYLGLVPWICTKLPQNVKKELEKLK